MTLNAGTLLDSGERRGMPLFVAEEAALICALHIALKEEAFSNDEAIRIIEAWLSGPRAAGSLSE